MEANSVKKVLLGLLVMMSSVAFAGGPKDGIKFQHLSLEEALAKAKAENKLVFIDVFTTWCGPCKYLSTKVFTDEDLGTYYNEHFISVKFDAEKGEGLDIASRFAVDAYPTLLYLSPEGELVRKVEGAYESATLQYFGSTAVDPTSSRSFKLQEKLNKEPDNREVHGALIKELDDEGKDVTELVNLYLERHPDLDFSRSSDLLAFRFSDKGLGDPITDQFLTKFEQIPDEDLYLVKDKVLGLLDAAMMQALSDGDASGFDQMVEDLYPVYSHAFGEEGFTKEKLLEKLKEIFEANS